MKLRSFTRTLLAGATAAVLGAGVLPLSSAVAASPFDGSSSDRAAASCYEIKQNNPDAPSGAYWLYTPQMDAPQQFYCDQETNGGGWVLIGRGREGWSEDYAGKGRASQLVSNPDGTDAFNPVQLDSKTVDALLGDQAPSDLADGIRIRRAADAAGNQWQNLYANRTDMQSWTWTLQAKANWSNIFFDNPAGIARDYSATSSLGRVGNWDNGYNALAFTTIKAFNWKVGFSYGYMVRGNNSSDSYLWTPIGYSAMPFTQVYLRPKLTQENAGFTQIGDEGATKKIQRQIPNSYSAAMRWRTSEDSGTGVLSELNTRVQAITQVGNTVFTGGDFKNVVSSSGEVVNQAFLAGYNVNSSELVRSFTPTFNGQIKALKGLSNGKLAVGGEFTQVNGEDVAGFVVLDPVTGEIDRTNGWVVENRLKSGITSVRTIDESNGYVYIGGSFTHVKGLGSAYAVYARNAARFDIASGRVDTQWRPAFNGTVNGISPAEDQSAVYAAGYFSTNHGVKAWKLAQLNTTDGKLKSDWDWKLSYPANYAPSRAGFQFDVQAAGETVWAAGAEHFIAQYDVSDLSRRSSSIAIEGGDFQDLLYDSDSDVIYGACHCGNWIYEGAEDYAKPWDAATSIQRIRLVGAWDAKSGKYLPEFNPNISGYKGYGVWESFIDSTGVLWVGGDIVKTQGANGMQNTVGFARFTPKDITPAAAPKNLTVETVAGKDQLSWTKGTYSNTAYQVLRNDRVVASIPSGTTSYEVDHQDGARYFVRSVDNAGNYSASTPVAVAETNQVVEPIQPDDPTEPVVDNVVIAAGADWDYIRDGFDVSSDWKYPETTVIGWNQAKAPMGWGATNIETTVGNADGLQPASMYLRKNITIDDPTEYSKLVFKIRSDDGSVLYVNGQEVNRDNMAADVPVTAFSTANSPRSDEEAQNNWITVEVPTSELQAGENTIALSVHGSDRFGAAVSFDLSATLVK